MLATKRVAWMTAFRVVQERGVQYLVTPWEPQLNKQNRLWETGRHMGRDKKSPESKAGRKVEMLYRNSGGNQSRPGKVATTGSEFCVVVRDGGTKRKQRALKPWD